MTPLRQKMIKAMELRNLSKNTQRYYLSAVIGVAPLLHLKTDHHQRRSIYPPVFDPYPAKGLCQNPTLWLFGQSQPHSQFELYPALAKIALSVAQNHPLPSKNHVKAHTTGSIDITLCPCCKKGKMKLVAEIPRQSGKHPYNFIRPPNDQPCPTA